MGDPFIPLQLHGSHTGPNEGKTLLCVMMPSPKLPDVKRTHPQALPMLRIDMEQTR